MNQTYLLFKKDFTEKYASLFRKKKKDIIGYLMTLMLILIIYGTFIYVYDKFSEMYLNQIFDDQSNKIKRLFELSTMTYAGVIVFNVIIGVKQIYKTIMSTKNMEVLVVLPITSRTIFIYKMLKIYFSQVLSTLIITLPIGIIIGSIGNLGISYYLTIIIHLLLVPMISCGISAIFSIFYNYIMDFIENRFVLHLICYVIIIGVGFYLYSMFLRLLTTILQNGDIAYFFELKRVLRINKLSNKLFPVNFLGNMVIEKKYGLSLLGVLGFAGLCVCITAFVVGFIYHKILQNKLEGINKGIKVNAINFKERSQVLTLLEKEFKVVLRTPGYAFQAFATTITLPFMVYVCVNILKKMLFKIPILSLLSLDFELALFVVSMFVVLTNTFCTTNISRDGKMFYILKTLPLKGKTIVLSKVLFCFIITEVSLVLTSLLLVIMNSVSFLQVLIIFIFTSVLSLSEIMVATRRNLNNLNITENNEDELEEENVSTSFVIFGGIMISLFSGVTTTILKVVLTMVLSSFITSVIIILYLSVVIVIVFLLCRWYLLRKLNQHFHEFEG